MVLYSQQLLLKYAEYHNPKAKIARLVRDGVLTHVCRGIYLDRTAISRFALAGLIYGPSYVSFESALAFYGLIPERVPVTLSATFRKRRSKSYRTPIGTFQYRDIPAEAFRFGVTHRVSEDGIGFLLASPEKAICDQLYKIGPLDSKRAIASYLFDSMRIDDDDFFELNLNLLRKLTSRYCSRNHQFLYDYLKDATA